MTRKFPPSRTRLHLLAVVPLCLLALIWANLLPAVAARAYPVSQVPRAQLLSPRLMSPGPQLWKGQNTNGLPLPCQSPGANPTCFTPDQIQKAYGVAPLIAAGIDGRGQTIGIVGDTISPTMLSDLQAFDRAFGLPDPPALNTASVDCSLTTWSCQAGPPPPANPSFSVETMIDLEWAHALAPRAAIDLTVVDDSTATTAAQTLEYWVADAAYMIDHGQGQIVSLSVGFAPQCSPAAFIAFEHSAFARATARHVTVVAGAGDTGSTQFTCDVSSFFTSPTVAIPASDPNVLAVGGTSLTARHDGTYVSESAWTQVSASANNGAGGGGHSTLYAKPAYQLAVPGAWRGIPDVSVNADNNTGYIAECSFCNSNQRVFFNLGGTSISGPVWAGLIALADQLAGHSLGFVNPGLYQIAQGPWRTRAFHDITSGNNSYSFINGSGQTVTVPGFNAAPGWDAATGLGSPNAVYLLPLLATLAG